MMKRAHIRAAILTLLLATLAAVSVNQVLPLEPSWLRGYLSVPSSSVTTPSSLPIVYDFPDVPPSHPFHAAITYGRTYDLFQGYPNDTFQPGRTINRAEFTKIITAATFAQAEIDGCTLPLPFRDTDDATWYARFLCLASMNGVIQGHPDGRFKPADPVNVAEASKILVRTLGVELTHQNYSPWYRPFLETLTAARAYPPSIVLPNQELTRGEMAEILYRLRSRLPVRSPILLHLAAQSQFSSPLPGYSQSSAYTRASTSSLAGSAGSLASSAGSSLTSTSVSSVLSSVRSLSSSSIVASSQSSVAVSSSTPSSPSSSSSSSFSVPGQSAPQVLLTTSALTLLRGKVSAATPQWQQFKSRLDASLNTVINGQSGDQLSWIADYALGYQALKDADAGSAAQYADKAIGLMRSGLNDHQNGPYASRQFLARGNGSTTYTLLHANIIPGTVRAYVSPVITKTITRNTITDPALVARGEHLRDDVDANAYILQVSSTSEGNPDYQKNADWEEVGYGGGDGHNLIDWSPPGIEPFPGLDYFVTFTRPLTGAVQIAVTVSGNQITFGAAIPASQAIFVEYLYGTHAADYSTLAYQQTGLGFGGPSLFSSHRYMDRYLAMGYDWLYNYPGFSPALRGEVSAALLAHFSRLLSDVTTTYYPESYDFAEFYAAAAASAAALGGGRTPQGPSLMNSTLLLRQNQLIPFLKRADVSPIGGFWPEGWHYGERAVAEILLAGLTFQAIGILTPLDEGLLGADVMKELLYDQPTLATVFDGGGGPGIFPRPLPSKRLLYLIAAAAASSPVRGYANELIATAGGGAQTNDYYDVLFRNPSAQRVNTWPADLGLAHHAIGTGLVTGRAAWDYASTWFAFFLGNYSYAYNQMRTPGHFQIQRGADALLVNANALRPSYSGGGASVANLIYNAYGMDNSYGPTVGTAGAHISAYQAASDYVYAGGDYHEAYSGAGAGSQPGGPVARLTRQLVYVRPDTFVVYDRVGLRGNYSCDGQTPCPTSLRLHFLAQPQITGSAFAETVGGSKLLGSIFSGISPITTQAAPVVVGNATIWQLTATSLAPDVHYTTVLETVPASQITGRQSRTVWSDEVLVDSATRDALLAQFGTYGNAGGGASNSFRYMEGAQIGSQLVMFGTFGQLPNRPQRYTFDGTAQTKHLIVDAIPNKVYGVSSVGTVTASSQGVLSFVASAGVHAVTIQ